MFQKDLTKIVDHCMQSIHLQFICLNRFEQCYYLMYIFKSATPCCVVSLQLYSKLCYRSLLLNYFSRDKALPSNSYCRAISSDYFHDYSTIQDGWTALQQASINGHQKVVELLLRAGAKPDLQDKVRTGWDSAQNVCNSE